MSNVLARVTPLQLPPCASNRSFFARPVIGLVLSAIFLFHANAKGATLCVPHDLTLQAALTQASTGQLHAGEDNIIDLAVGTYSTGAASFTYTSAATTGSLLIQGGFDATCSTQTLNATQTVLNGQHIAQVLHLHADASPISVYNLSVINGESATDGGGIFLQSSTAGAETKPMIKNVILIQNHSSGSGGAFYYDTRGTTRAYLANNLIANNSADGSYGGGVMTRSSLDVTIIDNNTIANNSTIGALVGGGFYYTNNNGTGGAGYLDMENNIFWDNANYSFSVGAGADAYTFQNNDYDTVQGITFDDPSRINGTFSLNPQFVDPASGNFRLAGNSPALGIYSFHVSDHDLDGHSIAQFVAADLGPYQETIFVDGFEEVPTL